MGREKWMGKRGVDCDREMKRMTCTMIVMEPSNVEVPIILLYTVHLKSL